MKRLHRDFTGHYSYETDLHTIYFYKIKRDLWAVHFNQGMTVKTFKTLRDARKYYGI